MKLKCEDGTVRRFEISRPNPISGYMTHGYCAECLEMFGVHDTHTLKPLFKKHSCKDKIVQKGGE